jgi:hypothetical protein
LTLPGYDGKGAAIVGSALAGAVCVAAFVVVTRGSGRIRVHFEETA